MPAPTLDYHRPDPPPARSARGWGKASIAVCAPTALFVLGVRDLALKAISPSAPYYVWIELDAGSLFAYGGAFLAAALGIIGIASGVHGRRWAVVGLIVAVALALTTALIKSVILGRATF